MKNPLQSLTNRSTMIEGYSYDRADFEAGHVWTRSLLSGAICTGLTGLGVYCGYLAMDPQFAAALGSHALNFKLACGTVITTLLGYSLRDLLRSITSDVKTKLRVARANSWLKKGSANSPDYSAHIVMQQTTLSMVRFVEVDGGIKVYAIGKHPEHPNPILIDAMLFDEEYPALALFYTHAADIRSRLSEACDEWTPAVADQLSIVLYPMQNNPAIMTPEPEPELLLDDDFLDQLKDDFPASMGRASAPRAPSRAGSALRKVAEVPAEAVTH